MPIFDKISSYNIGTCLRLTQNTQTINLVPKQNEYVHTGPASTFIVCAGTFKPLQRMCDITSFPRVQGKKTKNDCYVEPQETNNLLRIREQIFWSVGVKTNLAWRKKINK